MHSHLLKMTMLSQRAVDYSIKSYQLESLELCKAVLNSEEEWAEVQRDICDQGGTGGPVDIESPSACCAFRIFGALHVTYTAATQIARNSMLLLEGGHLTPSSEIREMGDHVNGLVRLYTVALFKKNVERAATILQSAKVREWLYPRIYLAHNDICQRHGATVQLEFAIVRNLVKIAEESFEIGEATIRWSEGYDCPGLRRGTAQGSAGQAVKRST